MCHTSVSELDALLHKTHSKVTATTNNTQQTNGLVEYIYT